VEQQQQQQQLVGMQQQQVQVHMLVVLIILNPQLNPIIRILLAMRMIKLNKTQLGWVINSSNNNSMRSIMLTQLQIIIRQHL